jgi:hypothetical protein
MPTYLVERYAPGIPAAAHPTAAHGDHRVRHIQSTLIPADEIALCLFEAPSMRVLERALVDAGHPFVRIVEAEVGTPDDCGGAAPASEPAGEERTSIESVQGGMA